MLDVLHFLMEEDFAASSSEHAQSRSKVREILYPDLYGATYKYPVKGQGTGGVSGTVTSAETYDDLDAELSADIDPFSPRKQETKPFIPATTFDPSAANPFDGLDAPLG